MKPGKDEIQSRLSALETSLTINRQRLLEIDSEIENLSDSIARTNHRQAREHLQGRLTKAFDEKERIEAQTREYDRKLLQLRQEKSTLAQDVEQAKEIYGLLGSCESEQQRIDLRFRLRQQIRKMVEWIQIYPLQEVFQEAQEMEEPGIVKVMHSKYIDKVRIRFKGSRNLHVLYLKQDAELVSSE